MKFSSLFLIPQDHNPIVTVAWTLRHEVFFYILFGVFFFYNNKISYLIGLLWIIPTVYLFLFMPKEIWEEQGVWFQFLFNPYNIEFLIGCIIGYILLSLNIKKKFDAFIRIEVILLILSWNIEYWEITEISSIVKWGVPAAILIFGLANYNLKGKIRYNGILAYMGDASYSTYLTHFQCLSLLNKVFKSLDLYNSLGYFLVSSLCIIGALGIGFLFHEIIEKPVLKFGYQIFFSQSKQYQEFKKNLYNR